MKKQVLAPFAAILISTPVLLVMFCVFTRNGSGTSAAALAAPMQTFPTVTQLDPASALNDLDSPVVITGTGFTAELSGTLVITPPVAYLGETALANVTWVSSATLEATVPWGMDSGVYTLTVENPSGEMGSLTNAFTVTPGINVWTTGGPYGGWIEALALGDSQGEIVYAVVQDGGLFRSRDGGASWELIMIDVGHANRLEVDPTNRDRLYMAKPRNVRGTEGLYQSEDGGDTWTRMPSLIPDIQTSGAYAFVNPHNGTLFGALSADPLGPTCEYGCGLFRFDETLQTWIRLEETGLLDETTPVSAVGFDPDDPDIMYAGLVGGLVLKSVDGGETWSSLGQTPSDYIKRLVVNGVDGTPWVGSSVGQLHGGLYRYDGTQWSRMYSPPGNSEVKEIIFDLGATDVQTQHIWIAAAQDGLLKSEDGGVNWAPISPAMSSDAIALNPDHPLTIYGGGTEGVAKTVNGGASWDFTNEGLTGVIPYRLVVSPHDPAVVYSVADCIGTFGSKNGGKTWSKLFFSGNGPGNGPIAVDPDDPRHLVMASGNEMLISDDGWNFTRQISIPLPLDMEPYMASGSTAMVARSGTWLMGRNFTDTRLPSANYAGGGAIYLSSDGEDWTLTSPIFNCPPTSLAFDPVDENIFYAVTSGFLGGIDCGGGAILRSTDGGQTWQESAAGIPSGFETHILVVEPTPPYRIFLDTPFVSYDQGATWNENNNRPDSGPIISMLFLEGSPSVLYIGASAGIFQSMDAGQTWQRAAGALGQSHIYALAGLATPDRHIVYAATVGGAVDISAIQTGSLAQSNETLVNAGVYRYTTGYSRHRVYLPLLFKASGP